MIRCKVLCSLAAWIGFVILVTWLPADEKHVHTSRAGARVLPLPKEKDVFHFLIFGDRTGGPAAGIKVLAQAVEDANLLDPDLVMTVGDLVEGYNTTPPWLTQMREFRAVMGRLKMPWFPVAGNHDIYWRGPDRPPGQHEENYETHFGPLWYYFRHKNAGFVVLYTDEGDSKTGDKGTAEPEQMQMSDKQLRWLEESLVKLRSLDHVFIFVHHPRWVEQWYQGSNWAEVHRLLKKHGNVRAVFAGHIHRMRYDGKKDGIEYFSLAATGGNIPGLYPKIGYLHHMNIVTVRAKTYSVAALPIGATINPRQFTALRQRDIDLLRRVQLKPLKGEILLGADGEAAGKYEVELTNPASLPIDVTLSVASNQRDWLFAPDHRHQQLKAGQKAVFRFVFARRARPPADNEQPPKLVLDIDYLEATDRIRVPRRTFPIKVKSP